MIMMLNVMIVALAVVVVASAQQHTPSSSSPLPETSELFVVDDDLSSTRYVPMWSPPPSTTTNEQQDYGKHEPRFHVWTPRVIVPSERLSPVLPLVLFSVGWNASCKDHFHATLAETASKLGAVVCCPKERDELAACETTLRHWWALVTAASGIELSRTDVAVVGHSMGGAQALMHSAWRHSSKAIAPPKVTVSLSPYLLGGTTLDDAPPPLTSVRNPIVFVTGDADISAPPIIPKAMMATEANSTSTQRGGVGNDRLYYEIENGTHNDIQDPRGALNSAQLDSCLNLFRRLSPIALYAPEQVHENADELMKCANATDNNARLAAHRHLYLALACYLDSANHDAVADVSACTAWREEGRAMAQIAAASQQAIEAARHAQEAAVAAGG